MISVIREKWQAYRFKKRHIVYAGLVFLALYILSANVSCTDYVMRPGISPSPTAGDNTRFTYDLPLDPQSPWPKFRANSLQNGRSEVVPEVKNIRPWTYQTGKGIFSSPVVDGNGTVYIGSADKYFYAIDNRGNLKWRHLTGEIIDSSALLDDQKRVFVGSGDGHVYAFERETGRMLWKFRAHTTEEVQKEFGIKTYNVNWFEGNIGMLADGSLLAPNDNYLVYSINRETGERITQYPANEMIWSLPSVNTVTGKIFFGTCFAALRNVFCYDGKTAEKEWCTGGLGTNAATTMLTASDPDGAVLVGGFDGMLRAYAQDDGYEIWSFGARDHIYASPSQLADGTIIQPAADGTVYAINPDNGKLIWAFDTLEPIRSSAAIDAHNNIYVGSGEGRLFCINPDGTLRWAYRCIEDDRNDLNASPALGREGVYIAGESGGVFFIPYDYPLSAAGKNDPRCTQGPAEDLPQEGNLLVFTTPFGALLTDAPDTIDGNEPLMFTLFVRHDGDTRLAAIDKDALDVTFSGGRKALVNVSADRRFVTIIPQEKWADAAGGTLAVTLKGKIITDMSRVGLKFFGGSDGGTFEQTFNFKIAPRQGGAMPYSAPVRPGAPTSAFEFSRLAAPNPSMLPSWNQIGFDSLHYIGGMVTGAGNGGIVWVVGGKLDGAEGRTVVDPDLEVRFVLNMDYDNGLLTMFNYDGFLLDFNGTWDMPYALYRLATKVDPASGRVLRRAALNSIARCDEIEFYGPFLKLTGMSEFDTGLMHIFGGNNTSLFENGKFNAPADKGVAGFELSEKEAVVNISGGSLKKGEHVFGLLLVDEAAGKPIAANYARGTTVVTAEDGTVTAVKLALDKGLVKSPVRAYYMVDVYPVANALLK